MSFWANEESLGVYGRSKYQMKSDFQRKLSIRPLRSLHLRGVRRELQQAISLQQHGELWASICWAPQRWALYYFEDDGYHIFVGLEEV